MNNIRKHIRFIFFCILFYAHQHVLASEQSMVLEVSGVKLDKQVSIPNVSGPLVLNGAGVRSKFIFDIYIGALYLPMAERDAVKILNADQANRIAMHFLYSEVPKEKLINGWIDGFRNNSSDEQYKKVEQRLKKFNEFFVSLYEGDVVLLDYVPGKGTSVLINGVLKGEIKGADFNRALLSVWLGKEPVTDDLKDALLGKS